MENKYTISNIDKDQMDLLCKAMDFYIRIVLGQMEKIPMLIKNNIENANTIDPFSKEMDYIRSKITSVYEEHGVPDTGSLGIYAPAINEKVRVLYDMYKVLMYERGASGVYGFKPSPIAKEYHDQIEVGCNDEVLIEYDGDLEGLKKAIGDDNVKEFRDDPGVFYVKNGEYSWRKLTEGLKIRKKHNGEIEVKTSIDNN